MIIKNAFDLYDLRVSVFFFFFTTDLQLQLTIDVKREKIMQMLFLQYIKLMIDLESLKKSDLYSSRFFYIVSISARDRISKKYNIFLATAITYFTNKDISRCVSRMFKIRQLVVNY